ncbi:MULTISPECIES: HK97 family phage prohead protease [Bradyrhizobium]|uniref:HK97 family phage prohead protease n=1 Tax=Bradyrhizobium TaxID=374 RepID=UPI0004B7A66D|nr:HK97 family phage prohead protease [Bradyrhizobium japonicum]MCP1764997.1 HK97 family phage prohead protease [Bradyrhizobium japonicum]MCP1787134.1 HK97 family phage prohead protease [Bradyrhizobium japonicum]MCP1809011.1 HK97 family phage prohead protease [Bradyrhizobium japonicum]MCP1817941.1 HK97 family phage prohead protease [Bradyrhizobium japonicum]MCP1870548.1 HK97 family phage prohead protease [Bradyrhizobium japonicum]
MADNVITGFAVVFGDETVIAGEFRERIAAGAFTRTLKEKPDVVMLLDHDSGRVLGRTAARTLSLRENSAGLYFALTVDPSTPEGQTALGTVGRQDVRGCSFGFRVRAEAWEDGGDRLPLRTITDLDLYELTLTAFPAYPTTSAAMRSTANTNNQAARRRVEAKMRKRGIPLT